jgi:histidyl-tRNA synthetase
MILIGRGLWRELGLVEGRDVRLEINSLGQPDERRAHREALVRHFERHAGALDAEAERRLQSNPLRILDSKHPALQAAIEAAPRLIDFLGAPSLAHFDALRAMLDAAGLAYRINPRLVRGLDYYNLTVFEWVTDQLGSQGTVCGGGRYDGLIEQLGGKPAPAVGFGLGIERLLLLLQELRVAVPSAAPLAYAVVPSAQLMPQALVALEALRAHGVSVLMHAGGGSMKAQFRRADASGAAFALIFGEDEIAQGQVAIKRLREPDAPQLLRPLADVAGWAAELRSAPTATA